MKYHGVSTKVEDHHLIAVSQFPRVFGDEMLSLALGLEGKHRLDTFCRHRLIEYGAQVLLDECLTPRPRLRDAQSKRAKLDTSRFAFAEDALDDLVASRHIRISTRDIQQDRRRAIKNENLKLVAKI